MMETSLGKRIAALRREMGVSSNTMQLNNSSAIQHIDFEQVIKLVESGVNGKLVEVETKDGDHVEIWVE